MAASRLGLGSRHVFLYSGLPSRPQLVGRWSRWAWGFFLELVPPEVGTALPVVGVAFPRLRPAPTYPSSRRGRHRLVAVENQASRGGLSFFGRTWPGSFYPNRGYQNRTAAPSHRVEAFEVHVIRIRIVGTPVLREGLSSPSRPLLSLLAGGTLVLHRCSSGIRLS